MCKNFIFHQLHVLQVFLYISFLRLFYLSIITCRLYPVRLIIYITSCWKGGVINIIDEYSGLMSSYGVFLAIVYVTNTLGDGLVLQLSSISVLVGFFVFNLLFGKIFMGRWRLFFGLYDSNNKTSH